MCFKSTDVRPVFSFNETFHFLVPYFSQSLMFSLWERSNEHKELGKGGVLPVSCSKLWGSCLGLGRGEVISRSKCKVGCRGAVNAVVSLSTQSHALYGCTVTGQGLHLSDRS